MKVLVGSQNPVKVSATKSAFKKVFPTKKITIIPLNVDSQVPSQPLSENQAFKGARRRALNALKVHPNADFSVGLEGTIQKYPLGVLEGGMVVIIDKLKKISIGSSPRFPLSKTVLHQIKKGQELGEIIDCLTNQSNTKKKSGAYGFFTNNIITRRKAYQQGIISALVPWIKKQLY